MTRGFVLLGCLWAAPVFAQTTAHIWVDGSGTCVDNPSPVVYNSATACATIGDAASTSDAGDTIRVRPGTYAEVVSETTDGAAGSYITYVAEGAVTVNGWSISGDYVRVIGFTVEGASTRQDGVNITNANHVEIWNNVIQNFERDGIRTDGGGKTSQSDNSLFIGNELISVGNRDMQIRGNGNLIAYNESNATETDFVYLFGTRIRVINNYSHDINADAASHTDFFQSGATTDALGLTVVLAEANRYDDADSPGTVNDHHGGNVQNLAGGSDGQWVVRRNIWNNHGSYTYGFSGSELDIMRFYNETTYRAMIDTANAGNDNGFFNGGADQKFFNNLFVQQWGVNDNAPNMYATENPSASDYNLYYDLDGSVTFGAVIAAESNSQRNVNPLYTNAASLDFTLQSGSPARGAGGPLTLANGSGTGTVVTVDDGEFFRGDDTTIDQYGGHLVVGDTITIGTDVVTVTSISGNDLTVTPSITWADNDPVYWEADTTPDLGALPFKAGGYTLSATYTNAGGSITVTPNDADLVRWVICYEDSIPTNVDSASPFTCSVGNGTIDVRVYPRYPSDTLWAVAELGAASPSQPRSRLRIR